MRKFVCLILALTMIFALASCGNSSNNATTTEQVVSDTTKAEITLSETVTEDVSENTETPTEALPEEETETEENKLPSTKAEILELYTGIMNQAKKDKPGFTFYEWQTLPDDSQSRIINEGKAVIGTALNIANGFMKDEKKAKEDAAVIGKNSDMYCFPIRDSDYGCLLKNPNAIKSAEFKELANGNYQITIILNSEKNPEPVTDKHASVAPSNHGAIFQPLPKKVIDDVLANDVISAITDDISYSYTYHDCTAIVEYEPETNHIVSITQLSYVTITGSGRVTLVRLDVEKQEFINEMHVVNIEY